MKNTLSIIIFTILFSSLSFAEDPCNYPCPEIPWISGYYIEWDYQGCEDCNVLVEWKERIITCNGMAEYEYRLTGMNYTPECLKEYKPDGCGFETYEDLFTNLFLLGYYYSGLPLPSGNDSCISFVRAYLDACWYSDFSPLGENIVERPCAINDCCIHNYTICTTPTGYSFSSSTPPYYGQCQQPYIPCYQHCDGLSSIEFTPFSLTNKANQSKSLYNKIGLNEIELEGQNELIIKLYTFNGIHIQTISHQTNQNIIELSKYNLEYGVYLYEIESQGKLLSKGSVMIGE